MIFDRMKKTKLTSLTFTLVAIGCMISMPLMVDAVKPTNNGLEPDLQAIVPTHLTIQNKQQQDILRFTNGIANTGSGDLSIAPTFPVNPDDDVLATQLILDAEGNTVDEIDVGTFAFHAGHNHWHIADVVEYSVHLVTPTGLQQVGSSDKVTFCIEDVFKMGDNTNTAERVYWDCTVSLQGVQAGWADQYHQSTDGNQVDMTGAEPGTYRLIHHVNPDGVLTESDESNNIAWTEFELTRHTTGNSQGNAKIEVTATSCDDLPESIFKPSLCGETTLNRG